MAGLLLVLMLTGGGFLGLKGCNQDPFHTPKYKVGDRLCDVTGINRVNCTGGSPKSPAITPLKWPYVLV